MKRSQPAFPGVGKSRTQLYLCLLAALLTPLDTALAQDAAHSSGWVVIPVSEYASLRGRAFPAQRAPEAATVDATLTRVDYDLRIDGELAAGRATLTVDVIGSGWVRVPIPSGLLVSSAQLDGKPLSLIPGDAGNSNQLSAVLSRQGRAILLLEVALPLASAAGEERLSLPASASGVTRASVTLPRQDLAVKVTGGFLSEKPEAATQAAFLAYGRAGEPLTFTWRTKTEDHRVTQPLRFRGSITQLFGLGEDSTSLYCETEVEVTQGAAARVRVQAPATVTINQVLGATVADWEIKGGELVVTFLEPVEKSAKFVIVGETRLPRGGAIEIPLLRLLDAERETGGAAVEVLGAGEIKTLKPQGLDSASANELGQIIASRQSPSLAAFRFRPGLASTPRSLAISVARYAQQAVLTANIEEARYRLLISTDGKILTQARYAVRNNQRNFVKIKLPAGAAVWSASLSGSPVRPGQAPDGSLLLPLTKARAGEDAPAFAIEILYLNTGAAWSEKGRASVSLPVLDLPVSRTGVTLYYPPAFRVTAEPGSFRSQAYLPSSPALTADAGNAPANRAPAPQQPAGFDAMQQFNSNAAQAATQALVDKFRAGSDARRPTLSSTVRVSFPAVGPSLFLVSELTAESQGPTSLGPTIGLSYQKEKKGGVK